MDEPLTDISVIGYSLRTIILAAIGVAVSMMLGFFGFGKCFHGTPFTTHLSLVIGVYALIFVATAVRWRRLEDSMRERAVHRLALLIGPAIGFVHMIGAWVGIF
ncbi:MAG: hypothetical protein AAGI17_08120 [Planctomycetota bacterium]